MGVTNYDLPLMQRPLPPFKIICEKSEQGLQGFIQCNIELLKVEQRFGCILSFEPTPSAFISAVCLQIRITPATFNAASEGLYALILKD